MKRNSMWIVELPPLPKTVLAGRVPGWQITKVVHRVCPICDSDSPRGIVKRPDAFLVHKCSICGMIYLADVPPEEEIDKFYEEYGSYKNLQVPQRQGWMLNWVRRKIASNYNQFISILESTGGIKGLSVCDIGCSYGGFLELIKYRGGGVFGVEIDINAQKVLEKKKIPFSAKIENHSYDIICMLQVLEHLNDPSGFVATISDALRPDGRILISVPNGGEYERVGDSWIGFRVDMEHFNYFNLLSLSKLLHKHGLFIEHFWEHNQPSVQRYINNRSHFLNRAKRRWTTMKNLFCRKFPYDGKNVMHQGSFVLTVIARKSDRLL